MDRDHVGFFVKDNGNGTITTIEGNTSNCSDGNGDCVQQRIRDKKFVCTYIRLPYKAESTSTSTTKKIVEKKCYSGTYPKPVLSSSKGEKSQIKLWQKYLNWYDNLELKVDGVFGTMTYKATKQFQKEQKITVDGIVGSNTITCAKKVKK